ncbi:MAG: extracellular solute-binding protein [Eubacteriales bacterium]|nr:extracellular solute-binding protein [Eubacteriales bacterium]
MKKILALILVAIFVLAALAACGKDNGDQSKDTQSAQSQASADTTEDQSDISEDTSNDIYSHLRSFNLNERTVKILVYDDSRGRYKSSEIMSHTDNAEKINEGIVDRNRIVEELLNCKIEEVRVADVLSSARTDILGSGEYDIIMPYMPNAATLAQEGYLIDLNEFSDIIKLDQPYWDQRANLDLSIAGKLFFSTGDFSLLTFDCTHAIVFNKTLVANTAGVEDPYQLLRDDEWTFDALLRNASLVTTDSDGEDGMTFMDTWGLFINTGYTTTMFIGSGERLTGKDENDYPVIAVNTLRASSVVEKIRDIYNDSTATIVIENYESSLGGKYSDVYYAATAATGENRALFRTMSIVDLKELSDFDVSYGILPTPKFNDDQDEYYNIVSAILASCICIHQNVQDPEESAAVAEALAAASTETVRKAYYEYVLKGRKIPDEEGEAALDIIFNNRVYEMATIYSFGELSQLISTCAAASTDIFASKFESIKESVEQQIANVVSAYEDMG